jgi:hypothetical protein
MQQDQQSGATGDAFGTETAPLIAKSIGAIMLGPNSNEATYHGDSVVIKCAGPRTNSVGVTYLMLKRLQKVVGAFQQDDGSFEVISLPVSIFKEEMRETRSLGASAGRVGLVSRRIFESRGQALGSIRL